MDETTATVVGRKGKRRDQDDKPVNGTWGTDLIGDRDPDYVYQFFNESEVRDKLVPTRITLTSYVVGKPDETTAHNIPAWQICRRADGAEYLEGFRPDEGKPLDTVLRHGPTVCLKLKREYWNLLQQAQEQRSASTMKRINGGYRHEMLPGGSEVRAEGERVQPGHVRFFEKPMSWEQG